MEKKRAVPGIRELAYFLCCFYRGVPDIFQERGIDQRLRTCSIHFRQISALLSPVYLDEFEENSLPRLVNDLKWLTPKVTRHEGLIRGVMDVFPVMPVKFGAIYKDPEKILQTMKKNYREFSAFFDMIQGKEEWGVKVFVDHGKYLQVTRESFEETGKTPPPMVDLLSRRPERDVVRKNFQAEGILRPLGESPGRNYFLRKKRESSQNQEVDRVLEEFADGLHQQMAAIADQNQRSRLLGKGATGRKDEMILNSALLFEKPRCEQLKTLIQTWEREFRPEIVSFRISGPWPPYNFCPPILEEEGE